jgi:hypothetical protein
METDLYLYNFILHTFFIIHCCLWLGNLFFPLESGLSEARKALHSSLPCRMPGRNDKLEQISKILMTNLEVGTSASIYISGPPGTGKTACLTSLISNPQVCCFGKKLTYNIFDIFFLLLVYCIFHFYSGC